MVYYIHHNARKHGFVKDFKDYKYHSYFEIINQDSSLIDTELVISNFGGLEKFRAFNESIQYEDKFEGLIIEEDS